MKDQDTQRKICFDRLMELQRHPAIKCDILSVAQYLSNDDLIAHTDAYIDYVNRVESAA